MRPPMPPWAWRTPSVFSGRTVARTGWTRQKRVRARAGASRRNWRKGTPAWATSISRPDATKRRCSSFSARSILDHTSDETLRSLAAAYQKQGKASAAEEAYRKAISLRPNYWGVYSAFRHLLLQPGPLCGRGGDVSEGDQTGAAELSWHTPTLAPCTFCSADTSEAVDALEAIDGLASTFEAYGNLGAAYFYMRRYQESAENLQQALKIDDKDWLNWGNLGDTLYQIPARRQEALSAYRKAIELARTRLEVNPKDSFALAFTADYYAMLERSSQAREQLARALEVTSSDAEVLFRAAILHNHFGDTEKTLDFLNKAVAAGYSRTAIRDTPDFDRLKDDPRFRALLPKA